MSVALEGGLDAHEWGPSSNLSSTKRHPRSKLTRRLKVLQIGADAGAITAGLLLAHLIGSLTAGASLETGRNLVFGLACLPLWLCVFGHYRLYSARTIASRVDEASRLLRAIAVSTGGVGVISYLIGFQASRSLVLGSAIIALPICLAERETVRAAFRRMRSSGRLRRRVVIIGANDEAASFAMMFRTTPHLGYDAVGICSDAGHAEMGVPWLGGLDDAAELVASAGATTAVIATTSLGQGEANRVVRRLHDAGIYVDLSAGLRDIPADRLSVRDLGHHAVFYLEPRFHGGWRAVAKRAFDISASLVALVALAPLLAFCALLVKLTSPGGALFHQVRIGRGGKPFRIHKLRSMVADADARVIDLTHRNQAGGPLFKLWDDPRVTPVGRLLRKLSIDELPQLWNVLKGEMSLVGPRPALERELKGWTPELHNRLRVKPGVTGMWQVSGRGSGSFEDYIRNDLFYVDNWTLSRDLVILGKTVPVVLLRRGAC